MKKLWKGLTRLVKIWHICTALFLLGALLCQFSFDWTTLKLVHPFANLAGILLLTVVPCLIATMALLLHRLWPKFWPPAAIRGLYHTAVAWFAIGICIAFYFASGQGYIPASGVALILTAGICVLGFLSMYRGLPECEGD